MTAPIVFVHGLSASSRWWRGVLPLLAEREARLVDLPRFNRSFPPAGATAWLAETIEPSSPVVLVGHSLGGLVCANLAAERPDLVRALVLVAPVGGSRGRSSFGYATGLLRTVVSARPSLLLAMTADALRTGPKALLHGAHFVHKASFEGHVDAPTLLIWGARDRLVPPGAAIEWQRAIPGARLTVIAEARHVPMVETPSVFAERLLDFLDDVGDGPRM
jgi:pimeloyl-ACP methyl ester carboxylesterase